MERCFRALLTLATLGIATGSSHATPVTFDFTTNPGTGFRTSFPGTTLGGFTSQDGISVTATSSGTVASAVVQNIPVVGPGLGVSSFFNLDPRIVGGLANESLTLNFTDTNGLPVDIVDVVFGRFSGTSNVDIKVGAFPTVGPTSIASQTTPGTVAVNQVGSSITFTSPSGSGFTILRIDVQHTPEPASLVVFGLTGLAGLFYVRRRKPVVG